MRLYNIGVGIWLDIGLNCLSRWNGWNGWPAVGVARNGQANGPGELIEDDGIANRRKLVEDILLQVLHYLSTYITTFLPTSLPFYLHRYLSTYIATFLPTSLPFYLHHYLPTYLYTYLPTLPYTKVLMRW
jgi:hypothetical protein